MMLENIDSKFKTELKQLLLYLDKIDPRENKKNIEKILNQSVCCTDVLIERS